MKIKYDLIIVAPSIILAGNNDPNVADVISRNPIFYGIKGIEDYVRNDESINKSTPLIIMKYNNHSFKNYGAEVIYMRTNSYIEFIDIKIKNILKNSN